MDTWFPPRSAAGVETGQGGMTRRGSRCRERMEAFGSRRYRVTPPVGRGATDERGCRMAAMRRGSTRVPIAAVILVAIAAWAAPASGEDPLGDVVADAAATDAAAEPEVAPEPASDQPDAPDADAADANAPDTAAPDTDPADPDAAESRPAAAEEPAASSSMDRVRVKLDVTGEVFAPAGKDAPPLRLATSLDAMFDFIELDLSAKATDAAVERRYADAVAELRMDGAARRIALAPEARVVRVAMRGTTPSPFLERGFLTRDELDLLDIPFDPLLAAALRPGRDVAVGDSWTVTPDATAGLLAIDTVESGGLEARLDEVVDGVATITLTGIVDGAADGVPTHVTIEGSCQMPAVAAADDRHTLDESPRSAAITIRERREAGHVAPGFDVEARVSFARAAVMGEERAAERQTPDAAATARGGAAGRPGLVWHRDPLGRFEVVHEAGWRPLEDGPDGLVMRLVDHGALLAQCSIAALPRAPAATPPTIAEVERDLARSLADQFGAVEHASEATRTDGVRIVRVVATGRAGELPFRWIHAVLTDDDGHRLAVTCLLEASLVERFGDADRRLVDGIRLPPASPASPEATGDREARLPRDSRTP